MTWYTTIRRINFGHPEPGPIVMTVVEDDAGMFTVLGDTEAAQAFRKRGGNGQGVDPNAPPDKRAWQWIGSGASYWRADPSTETLLTKDWDPEKHPRGEAGRWASTEADDAEVRDEVDRLAGSGRTDGFKAAANAALGYEQVRYGSDRVVIARAVIARTQAEANRTLAERGFPETMTVWRSTQSTSNRSGLGVLSYTTTEGGVYSDATRGTVNRADVLFDAVGFFGSRGQQPSFAEDEVLIDAAKVKLVDESKDWNPELHPRDERGRFGESSGSDARELIARGELSQAVVDHWTGGDYPQIAAAANAVLEGGAHPWLHGLAPATADARTTDATTLITAIDAAPANAPVLYRGMGTTLGVNPPPWEVGATMDMPIASFSADRGSSTMFMGQRGEREGRERVFLELASGAKALNFDQAGAHQEEAEWLSQGRFRVTSSTTGHDIFGDYEVYGITQTDTFAIDAAKSLAASEYRPLPEEVRMALVARRADVIREAKDFDPAKHPHDELGRWATTEGDREATDDRELAQAQATFRINFEAAMAGSPFTAMVSHYTAKEIADGHMIPVTTNGGKTGMLVHDHGDGRIEATALYNVSGVAGAGKALLQKGIDEYGVNYVEAYGPFLNAQYETLGFVDVETFPFDPSQAADDWNSARFDEPDYHIMRLASS